MANHHAEFQRRLLGPLDSLLKDPAVTEVMANGAGEVFVERKGRMEPAGIAFPGGDWQLAALASNIAESLGRPLGPDHPILDARLADGSRVHLVVPPVVSRIHLNIRPFRQARVDLATLVSWGMLTEAGAAHLSRGVTERQN